MAQKANVKASTLPFTNANLLTADAAVADNVTFSPDRVLPNGAVVYADKSGSVPAGWPTMVVNLRQPSQANRNYKQTATLTVPTLETLGTSSQSGYLPGQKVGYAGIIRMESVLPDRMTPAQRQVLFSLFQSWLASQIVSSDGTPTTATLSPIRGQIVDLESVY